LFDPIDGPGRVATLTERVLRRAVNNQDVIRIETLSLGNIFQLCKV